MAIWWETGRDGRGQWVHKSTHHGRDRKHKHKHEHRHEHRNERVVVQEVSKSQWDALVSGERHLKETNRALVADNTSLKAALEAAEAEGDKIGIVAHQLQSQNSSLQRSIERAIQHQDKHAREMEKTQNKLDRAERETRALRESVEDLRHRNKNLSDQLDECRAQRGLNRGGDYWRDLYHECRARYDRMHDKAAAYEDILRRNRYI